MLNTKISIRKSEVPPVPISSGMQSGKTFIARILILLLPFIFTSSSQAQNKQPFDPSRIPIEESTKLFTYLEVVQVPSVSTIDMFHRGLKWFNTFYKNPTDVIRESDSLRGKISGKARFKIYNPADKTGLKTDAGNVEYTITLNLKDGRFRYIITDINWKKASFYPAERWLDTTAQSYSEYYPHYLEQMDTKIQEVMENLEAFMKKSPAIKKDDW